MANKQILIDYEEYLQLERKSELADKVLQLRENMEIDKDRDGMDMYGGIRINLEMEPLIEILNISEERNKISSIYVRKKHY